MTDRIDQTTPRVLALGMFDGVHRGHKTLIREAVRLSGELGAIPAVYTFSTHPLQLFGRMPELLTSIGERNALLKKAGAREVLTDPFDENMRDMSPEAFVGMLVTRFHAVGLVAGFNYTFGKGAAGTPERLGSLARAYGLTVSVMPEVRYKGMTVSSSSIRSILKDAGDVMLTKELLTRPYTLTGTIARGLGNGREMDFPTANLDAAAYLGRVIPLAGVYETVATVDGRAYPAVTNVGKNPTFGAENLTVETHLIGGEGDLYGHTLSVAFIKRIRGEIAFSSPAELKAQIARDIEAVRKS